MVNILNRKQYRFIVKIIRVVFLCVKKDMVRYFFRGVYLALQKNKLGIRGAVSIF